MGCSTYFYKEPLIQNESISFQSTLIGGIPVDILKAGNSPITQPKDLVLIIPGNPGIVEYYSTFVTSLYKELDESKAVWAISHSCHSLKGFNLKGDCSSPLENEIEHKLSFLEQAIPKDCKITLIGHSIGCFMILSVLEILSGHRNRPLSSSGRAPPTDPSYPQKDASLLSRIDKCYFLFPTIERMKESPNGTRLWPVLSYLQWLAVGAITLVSWLPSGLRQTFASLVLGRGCTDPSVIKATVDLLTPMMFGNMLKLAYDELTLVKTLHSNAIQDLKDKLVFYFGRSDGWCPLSYRNELAETLPEVENHVDEASIEHAFVLTRSPHMAAILAKHLR